jgi:hypothetical protein
MLDPKFTERNSILIRLYLEKHSAADIAGKLGITRERVRVILNNAGFSLCKHPERPRTLRRPARRTLAERFWSQIAVQKDESACWFWTGRTSGGNLGTSYGSLGGLGRKWYSHHLAWYLSRRRLPILWVLHECGNSLCCNPSHLYEGTPQQNAEDRFRHMRERGELHPISKLNKDQIRSLREAKATRRVSELAREYGISVQAAWMCSNGATHGHVE